MAQPRDERPESCSPCRTSQVQRMKPAGCGIVQRAAVKMEDIENGNDHNSDGLFTPPVKELLQALHDTFSSRRLEVLQQASLRTEQIRGGNCDPMDGAAPEGEWQVDPVPAGLLERRVELIGGCSRRMLVDGMNSGAKSYVADLWNMTCNLPGSILQAHKNIIRAARRQLAYIGDDGIRTRINPNSGARLMVVPRPLHAEHPTTGEAWPASFVDLALLGVHSATELVNGQGGLFLYLRGCRGREEARLWADMFKFMEGRLGLSRGAIRAAVILDNLMAVLDADKILFELRQHSAGLSLDPQAYAANHVALFSKPEQRLFPDREHFGLDAVFLRSVSLRTISICHRRQVHAMGAPSFVLPPDSDGVMKPRYMEMIADKEREAVDGHDGTLVGHPGLVNPAMAEFNKSMPRSHQMYYQREDKATWEDLTAAPGGELTTDGMLQSIRTVLRAMVTFREKGIITQGGRLHDRSSIRLSTLLLWHWAHGKGTFNTGLEIHDGVVKYLIKKEGSKLFSMEGAELDAKAKRAAERLIDVVLSPELPPDLLEIVPETAKQP